MIKLDILKDQPNRAFAKYVVMYSPFLSHKH
jgi:hypothetical protein